MVFPTPRSSRTDGFTVVKRIAHSQGCGFRGGSRGHGRNSACRRTESELQPLTDAGESRKLPRYVLGTPAIGFFGATPVRVVDISHGGIQLEHEESVKVGSASRL